MARVPLRATARSFSPVRKRACNSGEMQARDNGTKSEHELKLDDVFVLAKADDVTVALLF